MVTTADAAKLDAEINKLAHHTPYHFKMRVKSTMFSRVRATPFHIIMGVATLIGGIPIGCTIPADAWWSTPLMLLLLVGGLANLIYGIILGVHSSQKTVPLPWRGKVTIYTRPGSLTLFESSLAKDPSHIVWSYSELVAQRGIVLKSLLAELDRGIAEKHRLTDRLNTELDLVTEHRRKVEGRLSAMSELEQVQGGRSKVYPSPTLERNRA